MGRVGLVAIVTAGCFTIPKENLDDWDCLVRGACAAEAADDSAVPPDDSAVLPDDSEVPTDDSAEPAPTRYYRDGDGDGYGDPATSVEAYERPGTWVTDGTDCDDTVASRYPGAPELCEDGLDNDCDDSTDPDAACQKEGTYTVEDATDVLTGESPTDGAGYMVVGAGDVDGNGVQDLLVGAPYWVSETCSSDIGAYYLWTSLGSGGGSLSDAPYRFIDGPCSGTRYGGMGYGPAGSLGDGDGDGYGDIFVTGQGVLVAYAGSTLLSATGAAPIEFNVSEYDARIIAGTSNSNFAAVDVLYGDGVIDVAACSTSMFGVGVYSGATLSDATVDWSGRATATYGSGDPYFCSVGALGVSAEGTAGLAVVLSWEDPAGKPNAGIAWILDELPTEDAALSDVAYGINGENTTYPLGYSGRDAAGVGNVDDDVDGDGHPDFSISAHGTEWGLYVFFGPLTRDKAVSDADLFISGAYGWYTNAALGDFDGDGTDDLLAMYEGTSARVYYGPLEAGVLDAVDDADVTITDATCGGGVGDVDGDGRDDLGVGYVGGRGSAFLIPGAAF